MGIACSVPHLCCSSPFPFLFCDPCRLGHLSTFQGEFSRSARDMKLCCVNCFSSASGTDTSRKGKYYTLSFFFPKGNHMFLPFLSQETMHVVHIHSWLLSVHFQQNQKNQLMKISACSLITNWNLQPVASIPPTRLEKEALALSTRLVPPLQNWIHRTLALEPN